MSTDITAQGLAVIAGQIANGAISIYDNVATDARTATAKIDGVTIRNADITCGSIGPGATVSPIHVVAQGVAGVRIQGRFCAYGTPMQEYLVQQSTGIEIDQEIAYDGGVSTVTPGVVSTSSGYGNFSSFARAHPAKNKIQTPYADGIATGTPGTMPTAWNGLVSSQSGISRSVAAITGPDGRQGFALTLTGTATAANTWNIIPQGFTDIPAVSGQTRRGAVTLSLLAGSLSGITTNLEVQGRTSGGSLLEAGATNVTSLIGAAWGRYSNVYTMANASTAYTNLLLQISIANTTVVNCTIGFFYPEMD